MEKFQKKTVDLFVSFDKVEEKYSCGICGKLYVHVKACISHVNDCHSADPKFKAKKEEIKKQHKENNFNYYKESLYHEFERNESKWQEAKAEFLGKLKTGRIENTLGWYAEDIVKSEERYLIMKKVEDFFHKTINGDFSLDNLKAFYNGVTSRITEIKTELIDRPYRHSSSSLMSNAVDEWKAYAKADSVAGRSWSGLSSLVHYTEKMIDILEGKED